MNQTKQRTQPTTMNRPPFDNPSFILRKGKVVIVVGGTFQNLATYPEAANADVVVYTDVKTELEAARAARGVKAVTLARAESMVSLVQSTNSPDGLKAYVAGHPAASVTNGLGQLRAIGGLAAEKLTRSPAFRRFVVNQIVEPLLLIHNGTLEEIEIVVLSSGAGGTGAGAARRVALAVDKIVVDCTQALVSVEIVRVGAMSYISLGERVTTNAAGTVVEDLDFALTTDRHPKETHRVDVTELPMCGKDKDRRNMFAAQIVQARRSTQFREEFDRRAANAALNSPLGGVSIINSSFWDTLTPVDVAAEVAHKYGPMFEALLNTPAAPDVVRGVGVERTEAMEPGLTTDALVRMARENGRVKPAHYDEMILQTPEYNAVIHLQMAGNVSLDMLADFPRYCRKPCRTGQQYAERIGTLKAQEQAIGAEIASRQEELATCQPKRRAAECELKRRTDQHYCEWHSWWNLSPRGNRLARLRNAVIRYRETAWPCAAIQAELDALQEARNAVFQARRKVEAALRRPLEIVGQFKALDAGGKQALVEVDVHRFDNVIARLSECETDAKVIRALATGATNVTLAGLARIAGADSADPNSVVRQLIRARPPVTSPTWGGQTPVTEGWTAIVLPPVSPGLLGELKEAARDTFPGKVQIVAADSAAAGGHNIVELQVLAPTRTEELVTPLLADQLPTVAANKDLYLVDAEGLDLHALAEGQFELSDPAALRVA